MNLVRPSKSTSYTIIPYHHLHSPLFHSKNTVRYDNHNKLLKLTYNNNVVYAKKLLCVRAYNADREVEGDDDDDGEDNAAGNGERKGFLSLEEAGLVEISGLSTHERFLCRLTISSLNLLRVIAEQEKCTIEELNAGRICDWFLKDKLKREQNIGSAVLQWDDDDPFAQF